METLVLHTLPPTNLPPGRTANEFDLTQAANAVAQALPRAVTVGVVGQPTEVLAVLRELKPKVVFNLCEAPLGRPDLEAHIASLFEWQGVPFTGSGSQTLALCRRKDRTQAVLAAACVPVPRTGVFPCIVKPADEDGSACIHADSICETEEQLRCAKARLQGAAVVEEFLPGREFCIALWGGTEPEHVSISETVFENGLRLLTYAAKWDEASEDYKNSPLHYDSAIEPGLRERLIVTAKAAWRAVGAGLHSPRSAPGLGRCAARTRCESQSRDDARHGHAPRRARSRLDVGEICAETNRMGFGVMLCRLHCPC